MKMVRRIMALTLTMLMIVTMIPQDIQPVYAAVGNDLLIEDTMPDELVEDDVDCDHDHDHEGISGHECSDCCDHDCGDVCTCDECEEGYAHEEQHLETDNEETLIEASENALTEIQDVTGPEGFSADNFKANITEIRIGAPITGIGGKKYLPVTVVFNAKEDLGSKDLVQFLEGYLKATLANGKTAEGINGLGMTLMRMKEGLDPDNNCYTWEWKEPTGTGLLKYNIPLLGKEESQTVEKSPYTGMMETNGLKVGDSCSLMIETWLKNVPDIEFVRGNEAKFTVEEESKYPKTIKVGEETCKHPSASYTYKDNKDGSTHSVICGVCGETVKEKEKHKYNNAKVKKCKKCGSKYRKNRKILKGKTKVVGLKQKSDGTEDKDYEYTRKEAEEGIGLVDENDISFVKGKEYIEVIKEGTDSSGKKTWDITYDPIKGMTEEGSEPIDVEVKRAGDDKHNVTVNYVLKNNTGQTSAPTIVAPTVVNSYKEGEHFDIPSPVVAVPDKPGTFYRRSDSFVSGNMGKEDQTFTVTYWEESTAVLADFAVNVTYVVEAKPGESPAVPEKVKQYKKDGESYFIKSPPVEGYKPDIEAVAGEIKHDNVDVTVTYKPQYKVTVHYILPNENSASAGSYTITDYYPDGAEYKYDSKDAITGKTAKQLGISIGASIPADSTFDMANVWKPDKEIISGTINKKDEEYTVRFTCLHPLGERTYENRGEAGHQHLCNLCHCYVRNVVPHTKSEKGYYVSRDELPDDLKSNPEYKNGATCYDCIKACGYHFYESSDKETCPKNPNGGPHWWGNWEKISDTECARTCIYCKETVTSAHAWSEWKPCSSRNHYRTCDHCHASETGTHGSFSAPSVGTPATCLSPARGVKAHCAICNTDIENVDNSLYGIMPDGDKLVAQGHKFEGGYVRVSGGHTQKCSVCGAFDMEHVEAHFQSEPVVEKTGSCGNGTIKRTYTCACGLTKTEEEPWNHSYKRDTSREVGATCEEPGTECYTCSECQAHDDKVVAALGHNWVEDEGNCPAECNKKGISNWHCSNPGCDETRHEEIEMLSKTGDHVWVPYVITKPTCTTPGKSAGEICTICKKRQNEAFTERVEKLDHDLETTTKVLRKKTWNTKTGADVEEEVFQITNKCKNCGYNFPVAVYTVAKSTSLSKYKIEPGNVKINEMGDGIKVTGQFWKWNTNYFNNTVNSAFKEVVDNLLNIYKKKEGSVITEFTPQFMNSLDDGKYEVVHTNGDELAAVTLTVKDHKFVLDPADYEGGINDPKYKAGQLPGIKSLDEWNALPEDKYATEEITVDGETEEYCPWMADGELLFYLGETQNNFVPEDMVPEIDGKVRQVIETDPYTDPSFVTFDRNEGNPDNKDVEIIRYDNGHEFDTGNPVSLFGENVPAIEMVPAGEGMEPVQRTNYIVSETGSKVTFTKEYLSSLGDGTYEFLLNYKDGASPAIVTISITGSVIEPDNNTNIAFDGEYFALNKGETKQLELVNITDEQKALIEWSVVDADGVPSTGIVELDEGRGVVKAVSKGTAWVVATLGNCSAMCRIDVYDNDPGIAEGEVRLAENKVTSELYSDEYARAAIWLDLKQNEPLEGTASIASEGIAAEGGEIKNNGVLISSASFEDGATAEVFDLQVNDDGTVSIIPKDKYVNGDAATVKALKGSYKSAIKVVTSDGKEYKTEVLDITLKKSVPKLKAAKVTLNSTIKDKAEVVITGGTVTKITLGETAPEWIALEDNMLVYTGTDNFKTKATVNLKVNVKGWVPQYTVPVAVNTAPVPAKFKLSEKNVTLKAGSGDQAVVDVSVTPAIYADMEPVISVTENKKPAEGKNLLCSYKDGRLTIRCADGFDDSKARTFNVTMTAYGGKADITVKTLAVDKKPSIKVKAGGSINAMIAKSPATLDITPVNFNKDAGMTYEVRVVMYDKKSKTETDVTGSLNIKQNGNQIVLTEKKPGSLKDGYEYYAYTKGITKIGATDEVRTKLKTEFPKKTPAASADVKVKGDFDVIRPETDVTVTPKVKNFYDYNLSEANLEIYKYDEKGKNIIYKGTGADNPFFDVEWDGKAYTLRIKSSAVINHMTDKFAVGLKVNDALATKKPVKLTFKMSTAKFAQSVKEINLSSKDRYSMGMVKISTLTEGVSEIESVVIDSPADKEGNPYFVLKDLGGGNYGIAYRGSRIPQIKKGTVKLKVFLSGNNTSQTRKEKPNATISVKVNVK